jgi:transposase
VALYFSDELRYGLMTNLRRSWSKVGARAVLPQQMGYANRYLFSAVAPLTGESFHLIGFKAMDSDTEFAFLTALKRKHPNENLVVVLDKAPCHRRKDLREISGLWLVHLPPYAPELNPAERFFEEIRRATANTIFSELDDIEAAITQAVNRWADNTKAMQQLLGYKWIHEQCREVN